MPLFSFLVFTSNTKTVSVVDEPKYSPLPLEATPQQMMEIIKKNRASATRRIPQMIQEREELQQEINQLREEHESIILREYERAVINRCREAVQQFERAMEMMTRAKLEECEQYHRKVQDRERDKSVYFSIIIHLLYYFYIIYYIYTTIILFAVNHINCDHN